MPRESRLICGILFFALVGCNAAERDWKQTKESNTVPAYTAFIAKYPQSPHATEAKGLLDEMDWTAAMKQNTVDGYDLYKAHHPDGRHLSDAENAMKNLPLRVAVLSVVVAQKLQAYVGGGANIEPPEPLSFPFGGGGGIPLISLSGGSAFLAGEVSSEDKTKPLISVEVEVKNPTPKPQSFQIGDLSLEFSGARADDFAAVGYGDQLCAMGDEDRRKVKAIVVQVAPQGTRRLSYAFAFVNPDSKQGKVILQNAEPASFEIGKHAAK